MRRGSVGAIDELQRVDDVAERLAHLLAGGVDHKAVQQHLHATSERSRAAHKARTLKMEAGAEAEEYARSDTKWEINLTTELVLVHAVQYVWGTSIPGGTAAGR